MNKWVWVKMKARYLDDAQSMDGAAAEHRTRAHPILGAIMAEMMLLPVGIRKDPTDGRC